MAISNDELGKNILKAKLEAIQSGKLTDTVFLVGAEGTKKLKEVHAIKAVMIVMSDFMTGLFNSPMGRTNPIKITSFDYPTFKLVVEFAHLNELISRRITMKETINLAIAADVLLMDSLKRYCKCILKKLVSPATIWLVLEKLLQFNLHDVAEACVPLLVKQTTSCISRFREAKYVSETCVIFLLEQKNLNITSEKELVDFCAFWAKGKQPNEREALRRLLPYLRLLSLTPLETTSLPPKLLTTEEKLMVLETNVKKLQNNITSAALHKMPKNLCMDINHRLGKVQIQKLITEVKSFPSRSDMLRVMSKHLHSFSNTLHVLPKVDLKIVHVIFLGPREKSRNNVVKNKMLFNFTLTANSNAYKHSTNIIVTKDNNGLVDIEENPIFLPKNKLTQITLTTSFVGTAYFVNFNDCRAIESLPEFKKVSLSKDTSVLFFKSFGFIPA